MSKQTELRNMLDELLEEVDEGLSNWEINFLDSLHNWDGDFTPKQAEILEKIWYKNF